MDGLLFAPKISIMHASIHGKVQSSYPMSYLLEISCMQPCLACLHQGSMCIVLTLSRSIAWRAKNCLPCLHSFAVMQSSHHCCLLVDAIEVETFNSWPLPVTIAYKTWMSNSSSTHYIYIYIYTYRGGMCHACRQFHVAGPALPHPHYRQICTFRQTISVSHCPLASS